MRVRGNGAYGSIGHLLSGVGRCEWLGREAKRLMWEYKVVELDSADERAFNQLGREGWEMVGLQYRPIDGVLVLHIKVVCIFKRKVTA